VADAVHPFWGGDTAWNNIQQMTNPTTAPTNVVTGGLIDGDPVVGTSNGSWNGQYACFLFDLPFMDGPGVDIISLPWTGNMTGELGKMGESDKLSIALEMPGVPNSWVWRGLDGDNGGSGLWDIAAHFPAPFHGQAFSKVILHASAGSTNWEPGVHSNYPGPYDFDGDGDADAVLPSPPSGSGNRWDSGKKQTLAIVHQVPEPFSLLLVGGGLLALIRRK
jgi:hypothetical protein